MENNKGDAMYEASANNSYYGVWCNTNTSVWSFKWLLEKDSTNVGSGICWNTDCSQIGYAFYPFVYRGDLYVSSSDAGVFNMNFNNGIVSNYYGFRPVCLAL